MAAGAAAKRSISPFRSLRETIFDKLAEPACANDAMRLEPTTGVTIGFALCAAINIGAAIKNLLLVKNAGNETWPRLFGDSGMVAIFLWGLGYLSVMQSYPQCPWTVLVFGVEKLWYVCAWGALLKAEGGAYAADADKGGGGTAKVGWFTIADPKRFNLLRVGGKELFGLVDLFCGIFFFVVGGMTLAEIHGT